jgi:hypothetical protein
MWKARLNPPKWCTINAATRTSRIATTSQNKWMRNFGTLLARFMGIATAQKAEKYAGS